MAFKLMDIMDSSEQHNKPSDNSPELFSRSFSPLLSPISRNSVRYSDATPISFVTEAGASTIPTAVGSARNIKHQIRSPPPAAQFAQTANLTRQAQISSSPTVPKNFFSPGFRAESANQPDNNFYLPPPAVTSFEYAPSRSLYDIQRNPLVPLEQQTQELIAQLQELLNYQAAGLSIIADDEAGPITNVGVGESSFSAGLHERDNGVGEVSVDRAAASKKWVSLKSARRGILKAMKALAEVKATEHNVYSAEESIRLRNIAQVEEWEENKRRLESEGRDLSEGESVQASIELRKQKEDIEYEIRQLEGRLEALKLQHSKVVSRISVLESTISSRTASCKNALSSINTQQKKFFSSLPTTLRNPNVALEHWKLEAQALEEKKMQAQNEHQALKEGMIEWKNTLAIISELEKRIQSIIHQTNISHASEKKYNTQFRQDLKATMTTSPLYHRSSATDNHRSRGHQSFETLIPHSEDETIEESKPVALLQSSFDPSTTPGTQVMRSDLKQVMLEEVETAISKLEKKLQTAESRNWKLLICCISAEMQPLYEARKIIQFDIEQILPEPPLAQSRMTTGPKTVVGTEFTKKAHQTTKANTTSNLSNSFATQRSISDDYKNGEDNSTVWGIDDINFEDEHHQMLRMDRRESVWRSPKISKRTTKLHPGTPMSLTGDANVDIDQILGWELKDLSMASGICNSSSWSEQQEQDDDDDGSGTVRGSTFMSGSGILSGKEKRQSIRPEQLAENLILG